LETQQDAAILSLVSTAITASQNAYIPYSHYPVGAALRTTDGTIYTGCNVENAAYPATICAERTALVKAVSEGQRHFDVLAVATKNGGSPCGMCRQMLYEFAPDLRVVIADMDGRIHLDSPLFQLLPYGFGPTSLE
jgi:cytidine deaminase